MSAPHLGWYNTATSRTFVRLLYSTHASAGGNVAPSSAIDAADIRIYKAADGAAFSATQRSSSNGITSTSPFDSLTGFHEIDIDLTDNTDAGFYAAGSLYCVVLAPNDETIDSQTITGVVLGYFEIGVPPANVQQFGGTAGTFASGIPEVKVASIANNAITANSIASDAITDAKVASDVTIASITGNVGGNVTGSVGSIATGGIAAASFAAGAIDAAAIAADAIGASELAAGAVDEIWDETIGDSTLTVRQALRVFVAALAGKLSGAATTTVVIRNVADDKDRITASVDADGNRTAITLDVT